ncbi:phosphate ABC transporter substrate-binding protein [uncultured Paraglaciecola sp.]|uniref:phosphate ABC transporter substrate-binding protein n=1 Tax=uncultured Paraglaciecola sp. TaxID=1765024 RepID=UPI002626CDF8|nr:phosphate ABC transporter substrate-binding protein [uncultured Paraglaciecola sp.]
MKLIYRVALLNVFIVNLLFSQGAFAEVAVVVNPSNAATLSNDDIKRLFLGKSKSFPGGASAEPVNLKGSQATRGDFEQKALGKSSNQMKAYWSKLLFSGKANPPKEVANDAEVINLIKGNPAAIGYVDAASVNADVKVVATF